jgi:hypothetical protein
MSRLITLPILPFCLLLQAAVAKESEAGMEAIKISES